jgi:subfamily B ATP-binding cassette protein MsbA
MCETFINKLDKGYSTYIGENGTRLSGGEKQRLSIARAFLKKSEFILLDEATSALDSETEKQIQIALDKLLVNKTTIVIAHRLSTILNSNKILVFDKGKIIDSGNHEELLQKSDLYKNFYNKQIQK